VIDAVHSGEAEQMLSEGDTAENIRAYPYSVPVLGVCQKV